MWSLGNMGGSSVICYDLELKKGLVAMKCPPNSIIDIDHFTYGVMDK